MAPGTAPPELPGLIPLSPGSPISPISPISGDEDDLPTQPRIELSAALAGAAEVGHEAGEAPPRRPCIVVLAGPRVGEVLEVDEVLLIGREPRARLHLLDEGVSRRHCMLAPESGGVRLTDLESTNGTWVDGRRVRSHLLRDGERFRVGQTTVIKFALKDEGEVNLQRRLLKSALRDPLTRAFNRRYFMERFEAEVAYAERHEEPLALLAINVDRFAQVNRLVGRAAGDGLLRDLAGALHGALRIDDVLARTADDGFAVIARGTGLESAARLAERLRTIVAEALFAVAGQPVELRISIGVAACVPAPGCGVDELMGCARNALARSKTSGRNRVSLDELTAGRPQASPTWVENGPSPR